MFFCEPCRIAKLWPESFARSFGNCEICGQGKLCYDIPSGALPKPRRLTEAVVISEADAELLRGKPKPLVVLVDGIVIEED